MNNQQIRTKNISAHMAVPDRNQTLLIAYFDRVLLELLLWAGLARAMEHVRAGSGVSLLNEITNNVEPCPQLEFTDIAL